jgi:hypothetical protein
LSDKYWQKRSTFKTIQNPNLGQITNNQRAKVSGERLQGAIGVASRLSDET